MPQPTGVQSAIANYKATSPASVQSPATSNNWYSQLKQGGFRTTPAPKANQDTQPSGLGTLAKNVIGGAINPIGEGLSYAEQEVPKLVQGAKDVASNVNNRINQTGAIEGSSESTPAKVLDIAGQGAGAVNDTVGSAVKAIIPTSLSNLIGKEAQPVVQSAIQSPAGQSILKWWNGLSPETQQHLGATGQIVSLFSNAVGAGEAKPALNAVADAAKPVVEGAAKVAGDASKGVANVAKTVGSKVNDVGKSSFSDVYNAHAQSGKTLSKNLTKTTFSKDGAVVSPINTIEKYQAIPKVVSNGKGGHLLDTSAIQKEATANSKAAAKEVDAKAAQITAPISKKEILTSALDKASTDKGITSTASVPAVQRSIKQIVQDYGITGDNISAKQLNEFREGANKESQAVFNSQKNAAMGGTVPKDVADRAKAFSILSDIYRDKLTTLDPSLDASLTSQRTHMAANQYAKAMHLSSIGLSPAMRGTIDAAAAGVGGGLGTLAGPIGSAAGVGGGIALSEALQKSLLTRRFENAVKSGQENVKTDINSARPIIKATDNTKSIIGDKPTPATKNIKRPLNSGFVKIPGGKVPQDDLRTMSDFTDYVAGSYKPKGQAAADLEQEAADLYDKHIGGKAPVTLKGLANKFGRLLEKNNFGKEQPRGDDGRYK